VKNHIKMYYSFAWLAIFIVVVFFFQISFVFFDGLFVLNSNALSGEYWRFLTSIFLHGGAGHLLSNLFALVLFGFILESIIGTRNFLLTFFSAGILANVVAVSFYPSSLGASGAIYGILGAVTILRPKMMVWVFGVVAPMWAAAIFWILLDLLGLFVPDGIGHIAHLSGIVVGLIVGLFLSSLKVGGQKREGVKLNEGSIRLWEERYMK